MNTICAKKLPSRNGITMHKYITVISIFTFICFIPFLSGPWLGMIDYPNHLARYHILSNHNNDSNIVKFYSVHWTIIPNIGIDLIVYLVSALYSIPSYIVSQFTIAILCVGLIPACCLLHYSIFKTFSLWPLLSCLIVYNYVIMYGFTNYIGGITLAIIGGFTLLRFINSLTIRRVTLLSIIALLIFFFHLFAFGVYGVLWISSIFHCYKKKAFTDIIRVTIVSSIQFVTPFTVMLFSPTQQNVSLERIKWSSIYDKIMAFYSVFYFGSHIIALFTIAIILILVSYVIIYKKIVFSRFSVCALVILVCVFLIMPFTLLGSGFADYRLPFAIAAVAIAGTSCRELPRLQASTFTLAIAGLILLRSVAMSVEWHGANARYREIMQTMALMEPGRRLLPIIAEEDVTRQFLRKPPIDHAATLAVIVRSTFVPQVFAEPEKQPIAFTDYAQSLPTMQNIIRRIYDYEYDPLTWENVRNFDYVLIFATTPIRRTIPNYMEQIDGREAKDVSLFRVITDKAKNNYP